MTSTDYVNCFSCRAKSLAGEGGTHRYMLSSAGCWAMFCEVLEREYSDYKYAKAHNFTVDAYACQHPGPKESTAGKNSIATHLACLYMIFKRNMPLDQAANFKVGFAQANEQKHLVHWLEPPESVGQMTIYEIWDNKDPERHYELCRVWAYTTFKAWGQHHATVRKWIKRL